MNIGGMERVPVFSGTAAQMAAFTGMIEGDLWYQTDTKLLYTYDGAAWNSVTAGISTTYDLLSSASQSSDATTLTISGLSTAAYRKLIIDFEVFGDAAPPANQNVSLQFNNDTGSNYIATYTQNWRGTATDTSASGTSAVVCTISNAAMGYGTLEVMNTAAQMKTFNYLGNSGADNSQIVGGGSWNNTANNISSIKLTASSGNIKTGSKIIVYGVK